MAKKKGRERAVRNSHRKFAKKARVHALLQHRENALPAAMIANRLADDTGKDSPFKAVKADLQTFFDNNPSFDFNTTPVDLYLQEDRDQKLKGVAAPAALRAQLKALQRVFHVIPRYDQIRTLLADDLHSAVAIIHVGEQRFVERYADSLGGLSKALDIYRRAEQIHAIAMSSSADLCDCVHCRSLYNPATALGPKS
jgi:hypothetical protein